MKLVGFMANGPGAGKSTAAGFLASAAVEAGYTPTIISFAKSVKDTARSLGWDGTKDEKGRRFLEDIGMGARNYNPDTWVNLWAEDVLNHVKYLKNPLVICDDCRFPNEVKKIKSFNGWLVKIHRDGVERPDLRAEQFMPDNNDFDLIYENNNGLRSFEVAMEEFLEVLG